MLKTASPVSPHLLGMLFMSFTRGILVNLLGGDNRPVDALALGLVVLVLMRA